MTAFFQELGHGPTPTVLVLQLTLALYIDPVFVLVLVLALDRFSNPVLTHHILDLAYLQELEDDASGRDQGTASTDTATAVASGTAPTTALSKTTTGATTTTCRKKSRVLDCGAALHSLLLGDSPSPSSINSFPPEGEEGEGRRGKFVLSVRDEGAGISEDHQALLFQEFMQFNATKLQAGGGSGLGTSIPIQTHHTLSIRTH